MQRGHTYEHRGSWVLRYFDVVVVNGQRQRKKCFTKLAPVSKEYPTKASVQLLADKVLEPINSKRLQPESSRLVTDFIENTFLPYVKLNLRASTYNHYSRAIYERHVKNQIGDLRLRDIRTVHIQKLIASIPTRFPHLSHRTLTRVKTFLSSAFKHAKREGILDGENPVRDVSVPGKPRKFKAPTYTMQEFGDIAGAVRHHSTAFAAVSVAALTGLRASEIRGLTWEDFDGEFLTVKRSVWRTSISAPKTFESAGNVPVIPILRKILEDRKKRLNPKPEDYIFAGERTGVPINLANLARRVIIPALKEAGLEWRGWHAFRRSLGSNLYALGVAPKVIQAVLRHSDISTTLSWYVQVPEAEAKEAMAKIEGWVMAL